MISDIQINGSVITTTKAPKILGVVLDQMETYRHHAEHLRLRATKRLVILRALGGRRWGQMTGTMLTT